MMAALTHLASNLSIICLRLDAFVYYVLVVKRMKFETDLVFQIFLAVVYSFMDSHEYMNVNKFRISTAKHFFKGGSVKLSKG